MPDNRKVIITGAARGIGKASAELFSQHGWIVTGLDQSLPDGEVGYALERVDVRNPENVQEFFQRYGQEHDSLDALVNNAALQICKPLVEMQVEEWDAVLETNLRSTFLVSKYAFPYLKIAGGAVVNISSVHAIATSADIAAYAASKGGVSSLTRAMAIEFAADGIRANAILPGAVDTGMLRDGLARGHAGSGSIDTQLANLAHKTVIGRVGRPEEIARAILFLADNDASGYLTGEQLIIDGGATIRLSTE